MELMQVYTKRYRKRGVPLVTANIRGVSPIQMWQKVRLFFYRDRASVNA